MILWSVVVAWEEVAEEVEVLVVVAVEEAETAVAEAVEEVELPKALDWKVEKLAAPLMAKTMPVRGRRESGVKLMLVKVYVPC